MHISRAESMGGLEFEASVVLPETPEEVNTRSTERCCARVATQTLGQGATATSSSDLAPAQPCRGGRR